MNRIIVGIIKILGMFVIFGFMSLHATDKPRTFRKFFHETIRGNLLLIGNTVLGERRGALVQCPAPGVRNGEIDAKLFEKSSATLSLPTGSTIRKAFLYWQGTTADLADANKIRLYSPNSATPHTITAQSEKFNYYDIAQDSHARYAYQGVADVTQYVTGAGIYTIKDLKTMEGKDKPLTDDSGDSGYHGGWALAVVYESPGEAVRQIMLYDGFKEINPSKTKSTASEQIVVDGFKVPNELPLDSHLYLFVGGADAQIGKNELLLNDRALGNLRTDSTSHLFNAHISPNERAPQCINNLGTDIHRYNIGRSGANLLQGTTAKFTLTSDYLNSQKMGDVFYPGFLGLTVNSIGNQAPNLCYIETYHSQNGERILTANSGDLAEIRVSIKNRGAHSKAAENLTLKRLTTGDHAPFTYEPNTLKIGTSYSRFTSQTDRNGDDMAENLFSYLRFRLGDGANASRGGTLAGDNTVYVGYSVNLTNAPILNSLGGYKVSYTSDFGTVTDETLRPCSVAPHSLAIVPDQRRTKVRILEVDKTWDQNKITTKISGKPIKIKFMIDPYINSDEVITIKEVKIYNYDYGTAPRSTMTLEITGGDPRLSKTTPTFEPPPFTLEHAYKHLKIHATLDNGTLIVSDAFAVRPERFEISVSHPPKAGEDFTVTISALNHLNNPTQGYNVNVGFVHTGDVYTDPPHPTKPEYGDIYSLAVTYNDPKMHTGDFKKCMSGAFTHDDGDDMNTFQAGGVTTPRHFHNGVQSMNISYPYNGVIRFHIKEIEKAHWSRVDDLDSAPPEGRNIPEYTKDIEVNAYQFGFKDLVLVSKTDSDFSYFESVGDSPDLLTLSYTFYAADKQGNKLQNYRPECYAKDVKAKYAWDKSLQNIRNLGLFFTTPDGTTHSYPLQAVPKSSDPAQTITPIGEHVITKEVFANNDPNPSASSEPRRGEAKIKIPLGFSVTRDKPVNPLKLGGTTDHKLSVELNEESDPTISGQGNVMSNMNLVYGRINATDSHMDSSTSVARVYYEIYCKSEGGVKCEDYGLYAEDRSVNSAYWYRRFPAINELPALELLASKIKSDLAPTSITLEGSGNKRYYKLQFSPEKGTTSVPIQIKHGKGADKIPDYLYFHPYKPYVESASFTSFSVSRPNDGTAGDVGIVKAEDVRNKKGASRISR
ncbi:MAG: DUF3344 domain-containing protein [Wolinella sp.]